MSCLPTVRAPRLAHHALRLRPHAAAARRSVLERGENGQRGVGRQQHNDPDASVDALQPLDTRAQRCRKLGCSHCAGLHGPRANAADERRAAKSLHGQLQRCAGGGIGRRVQQVPRERASRAASCFRRCAL